MEVSRGMLDRIGIYAALGVPEIWRYDGRKLIVGVLQGGGYVEHERSLNLPLLEPATVLRFVELRQTLNETACIRDWLAETFPGAKQ